jgi:hypothetical protein
VSEDEVAASQEPRSYAGGGFARTGAKGCYRLLPSKGLGLRPTCLVTSHTISTRSKMPPRGRRKGWSLKVPRPVYTHQWRTVKR